MRPGEPHDLAQVMNEQHTRLDLMRIRLSVDLEGDFSFHGWPCPLPVYDVVTKRAENQVSRRRESASGGRRNSYRPVNSSRAVQGRTSKNAGALLVNAENAKTLQGCLRAGADCRAETGPTARQGTGARRTRAGWRNTAALRRPERSRSPLRFQNRRLLYVKRLAPGIGFWIRRNGMP